MWKSLSLLVSGFFLKKRINMKKQVFKYKDAQVVRLPNKRICVSKNGEKINVLMQAILPPSELSFSGNGIRGNYKQTCFSLTRDAAIALCHSLKEVLLMEDVTNLKIKNKKNERNIKH
jgi:hypothetical protein